jgi:hypothetical protein
MLEHVNCGRADPGLEGSRFLMQVIFIFVFVLDLVTDGLFIRVNAPVTPSLLTLIKGFKLSARHQPFIKRLRRCLRGYPFPARADSSGLANAGV